jgi:hypothetical protein
VIAREGGTRDPPRSLIFFDSLSDDGPRTTVLDAPLRDKRAKWQLDDEEGPTACDTETIMGLQIAWLNRRYRQKSVSFVLLNVPGLDIAAFPPRTDYRSQRLAEICFKYTEKGCNKSSVPA